MNPADPESGLPWIHARLAADLTGGHRDWTDFFFGTLTGENGLPAFHPMEKRSRQHSIAGATAVAAIPEGYDHLEAGSVIPVRVLKQGFWAVLIGFTTTTSGLGAFNRSLNGQPRGR